MNIKVNGLPTHARIIFDEIKKKMIFLILVNFLDLGRKRIDVSFPFDVSFPLEVKLDVTELNPCSHANIEKIVKLVMEVIEMFFPKAIMQYEVIDQKEAEINFL